MSTYTTLIHSVIYLQRNNVSKAAFYLVTDARSSFSLWDEIYKCYTENFWAAFQELGDIYSLRLLGSELLNLCKQEYICSK